MPKDDNISDVEEQTAFRGGGGSQKKQYSFSIFQNFRSAQLGKNFLLFFAQGSFENCPGQFFYLIWKSLIKRMVLIDISNFITLYQPPWNQKNLEF